MEKHAFGRGRLPGIDMGNDPNIPNSLEANVHSGVWAFLGASGSIQTQRSLYSGPEMSAETQQHSGRLHAKRLPAVL